MRFSKWHATLKDKFLCHGAHYDKLSECAAENGEILFSGDSKS